MSKASEEGFEDRLSKRRLSFLDIISLFEAPHIGGKLARELKAADMTSLLEALHIGGKLAREHKAADMNNLQAVICGSRNLVVPPLTSRRRPLTSTRQELPSEKNRPRGSCERAPVYVRAM